jgi:2-phospho-L-lactate/phosphoenolpyruvate guanylyltransferase
MRTAAILPVKRFARAKQRLGASVADPLRVELARAMVADVLLALAQTEAIERTIVVTREQSVATAAREQDAIVLDDEAEAGQSAAASLGVQRALADGIERALCVPGDCPALDPAELEALLGEAGARDRGEREVVIVPDRHGTGTNGLLLSPPGVIAPSFGPGSCERHRALALAAGVAARVARPQSLLLDIDTGADLAALRERLSGLSARAPHTRAVLGQPERTSVIPLTSTA